MKKVVCVILSVIMLAGLLPGNIVPLAASGSTVLTLSHYGSSGSASGTGIIVATGVYPSSAGTSDKAPYIANVTGSHMTNLGSTRIGVMAFEAKGIDAGEIKNAVLKVYVNSVNGNIGSGWTRLAVYETENPSLTYSVGGMEQGLFAARNDDYSYEAAMWSEEKFTSGGDEGAKTGWAEVDVTRAVKNAVSSGKDSVVLRFQVPTGGLNLSVEGDVAPFIELVTGEKKEVVIKCIDEEGGVIKTRTEYAVQGSGYTAVGDKYISLNETVYTLSGGSEQTISVGEDGNEIVFSYTSAQKSLLAKYCFEDSSFENGAVIKDSAGNYDARVAGGNLEMTKGVFKNAVNMTGNGYIELPSELLSALKEKTRFSVNAYVKKNAIQNQFLFSASAKHKESDGKSIGIIDAYNYRYEGGGDKVTTGRRTAADTQYEALTAVFDYDAGTLTLYTDGVKAGEGSLTKTLEDVGAGVMGIGVSPWNDPYYNGCIDSFAIYADALSAEEVKKIAGKITVVPVYKDYENNREYRGEGIELRPGEEAVFGKYAKDEGSFYNYTARYEELLATVVNFCDEGSYEYVIECTSEKNAALKIADAVNIGGDCSEDVAVLPLKAEGCEQSSIVWTSDCEQAEISGGRVSFKKTDKAVKAVLTAAITNEGESCTKEFEVLIHAEDSLPHAGERAVDNGGLGYAAKDGVNLIDIREFDYTCSTYTGWTSGGEALGDNFGIGEGYNDCSAIFAASSGASTDKGSINPYIPLPEHTGGEAFILSFAAYSPSLTSIEWSNAYLCGADKEPTRYVLGSFDGASCKYGVACSEEWTVNRVAFTPAADDKYIRLTIGRAQNIGIDNISIVKAEKVTVNVSERYVTNETAYDEEPVVLGRGENTFLLQYGEKYLSEQAPDTISAGGEEYILVTDRDEKRIDAQSGESGGSIVFDYRYVKRKDMFTHPGVLNTEADLDRIAKAVSEGKEPYLSGYNALIGNSYAQTGTARAVGTVVRGGTGDNCALLYRDAHRAYLCAIRWKISGDSTYADCARDILNAWSGTLKTVTGNADRYLAGGLYGYELAAAAELVRDYGGFEKERMQDMLITVFYKPLIERFLYSNEYGGDHNGAHIMNYWANWDLCNMAAASAIGVFCDRRDIYGRAQEYYKYGAGNGSVFNAVPKLYDASESTLNVAVGQWQEAGRDMEHTQMGIGLMAVICEIAWNQGDDLYGWANNRFMYGAEYVAQYHLGRSVPFTEYNWYSGNPGKWSSQTVISGAAGIRPVFEMIYNHYKNRRGLEVPGIEALLETARPEGGAGSHPSSFDQFGFGTLLYTRDNGDTTEAKLSAGKAEEGVYRIINRKTGGAITADDDGYVRMYAVNEKDDSQLWRLEDLGGGIYTVTSKATQRVMSVENDSYANAALITTSGYEGRFSQQFAFMLFEDGNDNYYNGCYRITPVGSGLSLDVRNGSDADGTDILQYTYNSGAHQQWELVLVEKEPSEKTIEVNIPYAQGDAVWVFNAVFNENGIVERIERETVLPSAGSIKYSFTVPCDTKRGEYTETYVWKESLEPITDTIK